MLKLLFTIYMCFRYCFTCRPWESLKLAFDLLFKLGNGSCRLSGRG